jgi:uncharacterized protein
VIRPRRGAAGRRMTADRSAHRRAAALVLLAIAPLAGIAARRLAVDNRLERWVARDRASEAHYTELQTTFGGDEIVVVAYGGGPLFTPASLRLQMACLAHLEAIPGVMRVEGIPVVFRDRFGGEDPAELEREMTSTPFYRGLLLSEDATVGALLLQVAPRGGPDARRALVERVRAASAPLAAAGFRVAQVGAPVLIVALDELSRREALVIFPLAVLASLLVLAALLRSPSATLVAAVSSGVAVALTLGLVAALGGALDMLTAAIPPLLWVLGLSYSVQVIARYRRLRAATGQSDAVAGAVAQMRRGVTFSAITTALGFLSLLVAAMPPVRELGAIGAAGIVIAWLTSQTVTPLLLAALRVPAARAAPGGPPGVQRTMLPLRAPTVLIGISIGLVVAALASIPRVRLESNPLSFLPAANPVVQDYRWVGARVAGFHTAEVVLRLPLPWTEPAAWPVIESVDASLASSPIVARVVGPLDLLRKLNQWDAGLDPAAYRLPPTRARAEALLAQLDEHGRAVLGSLAAPSGREVRLSALVRDMDEGRFLALAGAARRTLAALPPGWSGFVTGQVLRLVESQQDLVATQLRSLGVALVVIFAAVWAGLRSWRLTLVAMPPNLVPAAAMFAAMAWLSIPLDAATVMVAGVALGIAVDNTIYILLEYVRARAAGGDAVTAAGASVALVRPAIVAATGAAGTGFLALAFSSFVPIRYFGVLSAIMMAVALACHLLLTPAILAVAQPRGPVARELVP